MNGASGESGASSGWDFEDDAEQSAFAAAADPLPTPALERRHSFSAEISKSISAGRRFPISRSASRVRLTSAGFGKSHTPCRAEPDTRDCYSGQSSRSCPRPRDHKILSLSKR